MPDNDDQAKALAAALLPHLLASLKADVLPGLIEEQIGGLKKNTEAVLDELKTKTREKSALETLVERHDAQMKENAALLADPKKPADNKQAVTITREQARDRPAYQAAKALAAERGVPLQIAGLQTDDQTHPLAGQTHLKTDSTLFIHKDTMRNRAEYQRLRAQADREHLKFQPISDWKDLPEGAVPHD